MQETRVQSLGQEDPVEEEMATQSSILAWEIPWTEKPGGLWSRGGHKRVKHDLATKQEQEEKTDHGTIRLFYFGSNHYQGSL